MNTTETRSFIDIAEGALKDTVSMPVCIEIEGELFNTTDAYVKFSSDKVPILILKGVAMDARLLEERILA